MDLDIKFIIIPWVLCSMQLSFDDKVQNKCNLVIIGFNSGPLDCASINFNSSIVWDNTNPLPNSAFFFLDKPHFYPITRVKIILTLEIFQQKIVNPLV